MPQRGLKGVKNPKTPVGEPATGPSRSLRLRRSFRKSVSIYPRSAPGDQGHNTIVNAFNEYKIGSFARAIILNLLHPKLPRIPVLIMPTCNRFDHEFVFRQRQTVGRLYEKELQGIVGPLIGHSSDGDSRRRKLNMLQLGTKNVGSRYRAVPMELGFVLSYRKVETENGYIIRDACDQDYIHNHKKLLNPLDHASRVLY